MKTTIERVLEQIKKDIKEEETASLITLLENVPTGVLVNYIRDFPIVYEDKPIPEKIEFSFPKRQLRAFQAMDIEIVKPSMMDEKAYYTAYVKSANVETCRVVLNRIEKLLLEFDDYIYTQMEWYDPILEQLRQVTGQDDTTNLKSNTNQREV